MHIFALCTVFSTLLIAYSESEENPYLKRFSRVNFNKEKLIKNHERTKRNAESLVELKFSAHEKTFDIKLRPIESKYFKQDYVEISWKKEPISNFQLYEGYLADEPHNSHVTGTIIDGVFTGTINSKKDGVFYVEPGRKYSENGFDSIVFHENDITSKPRNKRSLSDSGSSCGLSKDRVREALFKEQSKFGKEQYRWPTKESANFESESFKYSKEANSRKKRQAQTFPNGNNTCNLYLKIDPFLYDTIFKKEGNLNEIFTRNYLIYYLEKQVSSLNSIFRSEISSGFFRDVNFVLEKIKIYQLSDCSNLNSPEDKLCENYLDSITFLNFVSLDNFDDYCLSYTFTSRDFADGTLGLAWLASTDGLPGGICEKRTTLAGESKSLNSGIVSLVSFGTRVPERVNQITFAHEVGHSLGAQHDPDTSECQPGGSSGNFIMFSRATSGIQPNNDVFSRCSIDQINSVFSFFLPSSKNCLKRESDITGICGNGIIENGEVCDPGDSGLGNCCSDCVSLIGECDPSQGGCCDPTTCKFYPNNVVCLIGNDCRGDVRCTNSSASCPIDDNVGFKEDLSLCNENTQVCRNGVCTDSICDLFDLKQCYLVGNLSDPNVDKSELCLLACTGEKTNNQCRPTRDIADFGGRSYSLRPGSACSAFNGYCDTFAKCRAFDNQGSLARLANNFISITTITLQDISTFAREYWWAILLIFLGFLIINGVIFFCIIIHMNSDNPEKSFGYSFRKTLRKPFQWCGRKPDSLKRFDKNKVNFGAKEIYQFDEGTSDSSEINVNKRYKIQKIRKNPRQLND